MNHLWSLVSGAHEQNQGAVYLAAASRNIKSFLPQFGITINEDGSITSEFFIALENLVSYCCKVHGPGLAKLEAFLNKAIRQAGCYAHLRRYFLQALEALNLKEVFNAACKGSVEGFEQRVDYV